MHKSFALRRIRKTIVTEGISWENKTFLFNWMLYSFILIKELIRGKSVNVVVILESHLKFPNIVVGYKKE